MPRFGKVTAVTERPVGTTLAAPVTAGDTSITVDDISKLYWPAGGIRVGSQGFIYSVDAAANQDVDSIDDDEDAAGSDEQGTLTLTTQFQDSYGVDEPVVQFQGDIVVERIAHVQMPDSQEELVLRVPRGLWDRLPTGVRAETVSATVPETVALNMVDGEWEITDVIAESPSVDGSFLDVATIPVSTGQTAPGTGADLSTIGSETWSNPGNVLLSDGVFATATGSASTATTTAHSTTFRLVTSAANNTSVGSFDWSNLDGVLVIGGEFQTTASSVGDSHYLKLTDFGFNVPVGATITGVTALVARFGGSGGIVTDNSVRLVKGATISGADYASPAHWPSLARPQVYGGTNDLWGLTLAPSDVNASNFGVAISAHLAGTSPVANIDYVQIKVNYTTTDTTDKRSNTHYLKASNFGFSIPSTAVITGITADVERKASADSGNDYAADHEIKLIAGFTISPTNYATTAHWPTANTFTTYGGDLWGMELEPADVNSSGFGVLVSANVNNGVTASVDHIRVTVSYIPTGGG